MLEEKLDMSDYYYHFKFKKLETNFNDLWRMKSSARISLKEWLHAIPDTQNNSEVIANACSELIENCIKYSLVATFASIEIYIIKNTIFIETKNLASKNQVSELKEYLEEIHGVSDLLALYIKKLSESLQNKISRIGFIKIIMETQGIIEHIGTDSDQTVHLRLSIDINKLN